MHLFVYFYFNSTTLSDNENLRNAELFALPPLSLARHFQTTVPSDSQDANKLLCGKCHMNYSRDALEMHWCFLVTSSL